MGEVVKSPCTFLVQRPDKTWTYCGIDAPSIWIHSAAGMYFRCPKHQPSQYDRHTSVHREFHDA